MSRMFLSENDIIYPDDIEMESNISFENSDENMVSVNDPIGTGHVPLLYKSSVDKDSEKIGRKKRSNKKRKKMIIRSHKLIQENKDSISVQSMEENLKAEDCDDIKRDKSPLLQICCLVGVLRQKEIFIGPDLRFSRNISKAESFIIEWISTKKFRLRGRTSGMYLNKVASVQSDNKQVIGLLEPDLVERYANSSLFQFRKHKTKITRGCVSILCEDNEETFLNPTNLSFSKNEPKDAFRVYVYPELKRGNSVFIQLQSCNYKRFLFAEKVPHGVSVKCSYLPKNNQNLEKRTLFRIFSLADEKKKEFMLYTIFGSHIKCDEEGVVEETVEDVGALPSKLELMIVGENFEVVMKEIDNGYLESRSDSEGRISLGSERVGFWEQFLPKFFVGEEII